MNFVVLEREDELSHNLSRQFKELAAKYGLTENPDEPDIVVSIGGDGTLLHAFHQYLAHIEQVSFVGVHTGHLGFFADWQAGEIDLLARTIAENQGESTARRMVRYPLVEITIRVGEEIQTHYALNEFTLKGDKTMLVSQLNINDEPFEMFRGDGICVSTPSGSTAYNKSLGGAVIHPSLESIQVAEIASINNRVYRTLGSSFILPKHHHCDIIPKSCQPFVLSLDHIQFDLNDITSVRCMVAPKKVNFIRYRPFPFWSRVREAFIGRSNEE